MSLRIPKCKSLAHIKEKNHAIIPLELKEMRRKKRKKGNKTFSNTYSIVFLFVKIIPLYYDLIILSSFFGPTRQIPRPPNI